MFKATIAATLAIASAATAAPVPGDESGLVSSDGEETSTGTEIARGALWVPKGLWQLIMLPFQGTVWVYDRYQLNDMYYRFFYTRDHNISVTPIIAYSTGLGLTAGLRFESRNSFGQHEYATAAGSYGGTHRLRTDASIDSGERWDPVKLRIGGNFDRFDPLPFYGIGNNNISPAPAMPVQPTALAVRTEYQDEEGRADLDADWRMFDDTHLAARAAWARIKTTPTTKGPGQSVESVYDNNVTGFDQTRSHFYAEVELRLDRRHRRAPDFETTVYTTGGFARVFGGYLVQLNNGGDNFWHYGVDLQYFLHLSLSPRMLVFRLWSEGVTGNYNNVPFYELPYLGGDFLRGYDYARFRDRLSGLGSVEYVWDVSRFADAFLFADVGRVWPGWDSLSADNMRAGFGVGMTLHSLNGFIIGGTIATSVDGGINVTANLTPRWNATPRWR